MSFLRILRIAWKLLVGFVGGDVINRLIVHGPEAAGLIGLLDDVLILVFAAAGTFTFLESLAFTVFFETSYKLIEEGVESADMTERERAEQRRNLEQAHPHAVFLYGQVHTDDLLKLWFSGRILARSELGESVFQAVRSIFEILPETLEEVAIVASI